MTATKLQSIALRLSNQTFCRHWLNWTDRHENVLMAIQCRDYEGKVEEVKALLSEGFNLWETTDPQCLWIYTIPRTNDDGTPFVSKLF